MNKIQQLNIFSPNHFARLLSIPRKKLEAAAESALSHYSPYDKKKPNGKIRKIDNPHENIKQIQKRIYSVLLKNLNYPVYVIGGVSGRNPVAHATIHKQAPVVVTIDIKNCFPSITNGMNFQVWRKMLTFSPTVARLATKLTTFRGYLPQGAPTSTALANLVLLPAMSRIVSIASSYQMRQPSIYIDDIALSGGELDSELIALVAKEFSRIGLKISRGKKTKIMRQGKPQEVINKGVNKHLVVPRKKRKKIWAALHQLEMAITPDLRLHRSVKGRILSIKSLHPSESQELMERFIKLPDPEKIFELTVLKG